MKRIKLGFCDFWEGFDREDNYFVNLLRPHYDLEISDQPDFLIYSTFGKEYLKHRCIRIFYTGECVQPNYLECDYSFDFEFSDRPNHYRLPLYAMYGDPSVLIRGPDFDAEKILKEKTGFCCFVVSNPRGRERVEFFHVLSRYKKVDSGGRYLNNIGGPVENKLEFLRRYKFCIAFENQSHPGYTTEKLFQAFQANCVPIYWGNSLAERDFNLNAFLHAKAFNSLDQLADRVMELDQNDRLYLECLRQPCYAEDRVPDCVNPRNVLCQFGRIFQSTDQPVARTRSVQAMLGRWIGRLRQLWWFSCERAR